MYDGNLSDQAIERLKIMRETQDGFEIAERDMILGLWRFTRNKTIGP